MARTRIKICGITEEEALFAAAEHGADCVGFMFVEASPRYIDPETASALMNALPLFVDTVGVFADPDVDEFCDIEALCPTTYTQLHGSENEKLVKTLGPDVIKVVKFIPETIAADLARWEACEDVMAILVDGSAGGSGTPLDWAALSIFTDHITKPLILAGGLNPSNIKEAITVIRPYGVDVSSGVERDKGHKDPALIKAFCEAVREADRAL